MVKSRYNYETVIITSEINSIHIIDSNVIQLLNSFAFNEIELQNYENICVTRYIFITWIISYNSNLLKIEYI